MRIGSLGGYSLVRFFCPFLFFFFTTPHNYFNFKFKLSSSPFSCFGRIGAAFLGYLDGAEDISSCFLLFFFCVALESTSEPDADCYVGEFDAIGVFLWASHSEMDDEFPAARQSEVGNNGSSPLLGVVHNLDATS